MRRISQQQLSAKFAANFFAKKCGAFTFVEVLAALTFLAILIPAIVSGLSLANRASVMSERSAIAGQLAENKLNELIVTTNWTQAESSGDFGDDYPGYRWQLAQDQWDQDGGMTNLVLDVFYTVQGHEHSVRVATLANAALSSGTSSTSGTSTSTSSSSTQTK